MIFLRNTLIALFVLSLPFQDLGLRNGKLGSLGGSLTALPLFCLVALGFLSWFLKGEWRVSKMTLCISIYVVSLNVIALIRFPDSGIGVNMIGKSVSLTVLTVLWAFTMFGIDYLAFPKLGRCLQIAFVVLILGVCFGDLNVGHLGFLVNNQYLHGTENDDLRWRSFGSEASVFSTLVVCIGLIAAQYAKNERSRLLLGIGSAALLVCSASKGGLIGLTISCLLLLTRAKIRVATLIKIAVIATPFLYFAFVRISTMSSSELLQQTTTVATRSTMVVWGLHNVAAHPFGLGFSGYYAELPKSIPYAIDTVYRSSSWPLNFSEVEEYAVSAKNATTKNLVLDYTLFLGLPFFVWFAWTIWASVRHLSVRQHHYLLAALWYTVIAFCSYSGSPSAYHMFFVFGVAINEAKRLQNPARC